MHSTRTMLSALAAGAAAATAVLVTIATAASVGAAAPSGAQAPAPHSGHQVVSADTLTWNPPSTGARPGSQLAVLSGDLAKEGPFTIRIKLPDGIRVPPHWHPTDEHLTVIQGTFLVGTGEKFDAAAMKPMATGDYAHMPKETRHFGQAKGETIVQVHGMGPFVINYVNPADDPRNKKPTGSQ